MTMTNTDAKIMREAEVGDRVVLLPNPWWNLPFRKFADEGRQATVKRVSPGNFDRYLIAFDVKRKGAAPQTLYCDRSDFSIVDPTS